MGNEQSADQSQNGQGGPATGESSSKEWSMSELEEYAQTIGKDARILIIHGKVYDVTKFKDEHPGGDDVLEPWHLSDASQAFDDIGHSQDAMEMMYGYLLGVFKK